MQFALSMRMKDFFFDRQAVIERMSRANHKALVTAGAFIRRRARSSLRRRKRISSPGNPPSIHSQDPIATLKNILFAYDPQQESLVIGPVGLNQRNFIGPQQTSAPVPQILEFGANVAIREWSFDKGKTWRRRELRFNPRERLRYRTRKAKYAPRPFMGPALEAEKEHIPDAWAGTL